MAGRDEEKITTAEQVLEKEGAVITPNEALPGKVEPKVDETSEKPVFVRQYVGKKGIYTFLGSFDEKFVFTIKVEDTEGNVSSGTSAEIDPEELGKVLDRAVEAYQDYLVATLPYRRAGEIPEVYLVLPNDIKKVLVQWHGKAVKRGAEKVRKANEWYAREKEKLDRKYLPKIQKLREELKEADFKKKRKLLKKLGELERKYNEELDELRRKRVEKMMVSKKKKAKTAAIIGGAILISVATANAIYTAGNIVVNNIDTAINNLDAIDTSAVDSWLQSIANDLRSYADSLSGTESTPGHASVLYDIADGIETVGKAISSLADSILDSISTMRDYVSQLENYISQARTEIGENLQQHLGDIGTALVDARNYISTKLQHMREHGVTYHDSNGQITVNPDQDGDGVADVYFTNDPSDAPAGAQVIELSPDDQATYGYQYVVITNPDNDFANAVIQYFQNNDDFYGPWATALANAGTHYHDLTVVDSYLETAQVSLAAAQQSADNADQALQNAQNVIDQMKTVLDDMESYANQIKEKVGDFQAEQPVEGTLAYYAKQIDSEADAIAAIGGEIRAKADELVNTNTDASAYAAFVADLDSKKQAIKNVLNIAKGTAIYIAKWGPLIALGLPFVTTYLIARGIYKGAKLAYKLVKYKPLDAETVAVFTKVV